VRQQRVPAQEPPAMQGLVRELRLMPVLEPAQALLPLPPRHLRRA